MLQTMLIKLGLSLFKLLPLEQIVVHHARSLNCIFPNRETQHVHICLAL
jgi:hypothetical protein